MERVNIMIRRAVKKDIPELARILVQVNNVHAQGRPDLFLKDHRKQIPVRYPQKSGLSDFAKKA